VARLTSSNFTAAGTQFQWADSDDEHPLFPEDLGRLAAAVDQHTHASTRGLAVARVADLSIHAGAYQAASIATAKIQDGAITAPKLAAGAVGSAALGTDSVGAAQIAAGAVGASELAVLTGNPALRFGPLGHASFGSIQWNGDGGLGTFLFDSLTGGGGGGGRHIMQARNAQFHLLNQAGSAYGTLVAGGLDIQAGGAGISIQSSLSTANNANIFLNGNSQLLARKPAADNGDLYINAGVYIEATGGIAAIGFHRPGVNGAAFMEMGGTFHRKTIAGAQHQIWDAGNDGASSGLDADTVDGVQESALAKLASANFTTLQRGGQSVATLDSANFTALQKGGQNVATLNDADFTALKQGGNAVLTTASTLAVPVSGSYTGDGGTGNRDFNVGFTPRAVLLIGGTSNANIGVHHIHDTGGSAFSNNGGNTEWCTHVKIIANGFRVGSGDWHGNYSGAPYKYVAFRD
jgi:hypothetical protein